MACGFCLQAQSTGIVRYAQLAGPEWDPYTSSHDRKEQQFIRTHVWRITTFTPYFDDKLSWMPNAWVYHDSYAIYKDSAVIREHPEWILRDSHGNKLYIPFGCGNGTCPQYAGDIGNAQFRSYQIAKILGILTGDGRHAPYRGLFLDDVNLEMRVGDGSGERVAPMDARTQQPMTEAAWRRYFADFVVSIRAAVPASFEITHNSLWFAGGAKRDRDPDVERQISAANYINLERGFGDQGLTGGTGEWSVDAFMRFIDHVHQLKTSVVIQEYARANAMYSLAGYLLAQDRMDGFGVNEQLPVADQWPAVYSMNLGRALGSRYVWNGVWRRDFASGIVLMNGPGARAVNVTLPGGYVDLAGRPVTTLVLGGRQAHILHKRQAP